MPRRKTGGSEVDHLLKGRIAEALVESILRQAKFRVARVGRESHVEGLMPPGRAEYGPDFLVWRVESDERHLYHLLAVEVRYRASLGAYLAGRDARDFIEEARVKWPDLHCILVTDKPDDGRSCFQVLRLADCAPDAEPVTVDLHDVKELDVYPSTVREYERLARQLFQSLTAHPEAGAVPRVHEP